MKLKSAPVQFKSDGAALTDGGEFEAIVSVFDNADSWGDVVRSGAFEQTIAEWKASPNTLPVLWSHRMDDPSFNIGEILDIAELAAGADAIPEWVDPFVKEHGGLWVRGRVDTGDDASPIAKHALRLMKARRVTQFSYAYDELEAGWAKAAGDSAWEIRKVKLYEISPTQVGANELTELLAAKAADPKLGRLLSAKSEQKLRRAAGLLAEILGDPGDSDNDGEKAKGEDPPGVKPSGPSLESGRTLNDIEHMIAEVPTETTSIKG